MFSRRATSSDFGTDQKQSARAFQSQETTETAAKSTSWPDWRARPPLGFPGWIVRFQSGEVGGCQTHLIVPLVLGWEAGNRTPPPLSCTRVRGPPVALHVSRCTCRSRFPQNLFSSVAAVSRHTPPPQKKALSHLSPFNCQGCRTSSCLGKGVALQGGCSSYACGFRATLCNYAPPPQKRPDVHKIVLSIKSRFPPPPSAEKSVNFEHSILICTVFPHFGPFSGGVGVKTKFCGQEFYGHPDFSDHRKRICFVKRNLANHCELWRYFGEFLGGNLAR